MISHNDSYSNNHLTKLCYRGTNLEQCYLRGRLTSCVINDDKINVAADNTGEVNWQSVYRDCIVDNLSNCDSILRPINHIPSASIDNWIYHHTDTHCILIKILWHLYIDTKNNNGITGERYSLKSVMKFVICIDNIWPQLQIQ